MTDKELHKLNRRELLELLIQETRDRESLQAQIKALTAERDSVKADLEKEIAGLQQQITDLQNDASVRTTRIDRPGTLAEAAMEMNKVFEAAQKAADQYLADVRDMRDKTAENLRESDRRRNETEIECSEMRAKTYAYCQQQMEELGLARKASDKTAQTDDSAASATEAADTETPDPETIATEEAVTDQTKTDTTDTDGRDADEQDEGTGADNGDAGNADGAGNTDPGAAADGNTDGDADGTG